MKRLSIVVAGTGQIRDIEIEPVGDGEKPFSSTKAEVGLQQCA